MRSIYKFKGHDKTNERYKGAPPSQYYAKKRANQANMRMWKPIAKTNETIEEIRANDDPKNPLNFLDPDHITEESFDLLMIPPEHRAEWLIAKRAGEKKRREHLRHLELERKHRYGDDVDIMRASFTKTKEEIESESFRLLVECRRMVRNVLRSCREVPKQEKYVLGGEIRGCAYRALKLCVSIKKKYYRKNLLEDLDCELDLMRELYFEANCDYPDWITDKVFNDVSMCINDVGAMCGGLLKATVA